MNLASVIIQALIEHQFLVLFFGSAAFGGPLVLAAGFLSGQGLWSWWSILLITLPALIIADIIWYLLAQSIADQISRRDIMPKRFAGSLVRLTELPPKKMSLFLVFSKFFYGFRIATIIFLSLKRFPFILFLVYDLIGTALMLLVTIGVGWLAGRGLSGFINYYDNVGLVLGVMALIFILIHLISVWLTGNLEKTK